MSSRDYVSGESLYEHLRSDLRRNNPDQVTEILLESSRDLRKEYHVEDFEKGKPDYSLVTDEEEEETLKTLEFAARINYHENMTEEERQKTILELEQQVLGDKPWDQKPKTKKKLNAKSVAAN